MSISFEDKINFLRNQKIFNEVLEEDLNKIARRWTTSTFKVDEVLYAQGSNDKSFYIVYSGEVIEWQEENEEKKILATLNSYAEFGSEAFLFNRPRKSTITATKDTIVLTMTASNFDWLLKTFPQIKINLNALSKAHRQAKKLKFDWLHDGEVIFMITRRHPAELWIDLVKPGAALIISGLFLLVTRFIPGLIAISTLIGVVLSIFSFLWIIWLGFDWQNDYFIITNQRIVWVEEVIFSRSSRQEIPLPQIQFVNVSRSYWGRIFNFGDVTIRTYTRTGNLRLTFVREPMTFQALVDEQLIRSRHEEAETKSEALRHSIRQSLGMEIKEEELQEIIEAETEIEEKAFRLLKTREVSHGEITYHKHWMVLAKSIWWQLVGLAGIVGIILFKMFNTSDSILMPSLQTVLMFCFIAGTIFILFLWYHILDYRNDLYRLTSDMLIDLEKKPFGREVSKTAPLKNIQSIRIARNGIVQVLLNYGSVLVNVADETLDFIYVHDPAQVQRDIFYQKRQLEISEEKNEIDQEHERITDYLKMYREVWQKEDDLPIDDYTDDE